MRCKDEEVYWFYLETWINFIYITSCLSISMGIQNVAIWCVYREYSVSLSLSLSLYIHVCIHMHTHTHISPENTNIVTIQIFLSELCLANIFFQSVDCLSFCWLSPLLCRFFFLILLRKKSLLMLDYIFLQYFVYVLM